ncbi:BA14K family protein [Microvirga sp. BT325]|uniref:Lectin-like protein BA14k n=2 Tax=Microvirga splendida TaxID=2795727 RepID=A0ABS0Y6N4_9HYPH|nr:BA14K family protein [Microvirga splendida]
MAVAATAALGTFGLAAPASAGEAQTAPVNELVAAIQNGSVNTDYSQYVERRYYRSPRVVERRVYRGSPRYVERRYYPNRRYYGDRRYYRRDRGDALAAGALGLATGAIIGGALAQSQAQAAPVYNQNHAYCSQRFKSYDPRSGTYLGYDGQRHPCP